jgi:hypothetical protein
MMDENEKKETEQEKELYDWVIKFEGHIQVKGEHAEKPTGYPMLRHLEVQIGEAIARDRDKYRLFDYTVNISEVDEQVDFEGDME